MRFGLPYYISSDADNMQITIGWSQPEYDGGCSILGYEMLRNEAGVSDISILVSAMPNDNPSLTSFTIDMSFGTVGLIYGFKLRVINYSGTLETSALNVALASLPTKPENPPSSDHTITQQDRLGIVFETLTGLQDGGSPILLYDI
jgi:hypothetical protein